jgi:hypothetical protein
MKVSVHPNLQCRSIIDKFVVLSVPLSPADSLLSDGVLNLETEMERDEDGVVLGSTRLSDSQRLHRQGDATREAGSLVGPMTAADSPSAISVFRLNFKRFFCHSLAHKAK